MIYLSWSIYQLITVLVLYFVFWLTILSAFKKTKEDLIKWEQQERLEQLSKNRKLFNISFISIGTIILFIAFDVGTPQNAAVRSSFNQTFEESRVVEKVEVQAPNRSTVKSEFDSTIESKKETK
jgi:NADH:ubiquinone oxidoreductase subunit 3 (subunit A)